MIDNLPLNWPSKENSPELEAYFKQFGKKYYFTAEEVNELRDSMNQLYGEFLANTDFVDAIDLSSPGPLLPGIYIPTQPGLYLNFGGILVDLTNKISRIIWNGFTFKEQIVIVDVGGGANKTEINFPAHENIDYPKVGTGVSKFGIYWKNSSPATSSDIPGTSDIWKEELSAYATKLELSEYTVISENSITEDKLSEELIEKINSGGPGGPGGGIVFRLKTTTSTNAIVPENSNFVIDYEWFSTDETIPTGNGDVLIKVNNMAVLNSSIPQGIKSFSVPATSLVAGLNNVSLKVSDSYGNTRTISYVVQLIALRVTTTYDPTIVNTGEISFRYTPLGNLEKTIHFEVDGNPLPSVVTVLNNRQLTYQIPAQSHGAHQLKVYITALIDGTAIRSNEINLEFISVSAGNNTPVIATLKSAIDTETFKNAEIGYVVYSPLANNSLVELFVDGVLLNSLNVNRDLQKWVYKSKEVGTYALKIKSGVTEKVVTLTVAESVVSTQAETLDLELYLTAQNRSNNELTKNEWKYGSINSVLTGFNFVSDGWLTDEKGNSVLRIENGCKVVIPFKLFALDVKSTGKTIEFEFKTRSVIDFNANLVSCKFGDIGFNITPQETKFSSLQTQTYTKYKENERIRITILVTKVAEGRLVQLFINGVMSALQQYPEQDSFIQDTPQDITISSIGAGIDVYNIRVYKNNLNRYQLLNNFIADLDDTEKKVALSLRNDIYDDFGNLSYALVNQFLPCLTIIGALPEFKGDKVNRTFEYSDLKDSTKSFTANGQIDVQGTSSQYYPRKNWKIKFSNIKDDANVVSSKYKLRNDSIPESTFTFKADFAESSGTHNTGLAKYFDFALKALDYKTPAQLVDPSIRTTVDGFPCLIFHKETEESDRVFTGKYNFNNDKTDATFGFTGTDIQCWETKNNTSPLILFKSADFDALDDNNKPNWLNDFEARYPDKFVDNTKLRALCTWIVSTQGDPAKFKAEVEQYFDLEFLIYYYVMTEFFAMVDQRGKNMFLTIFPTAEGDRWYNIFYDNDTVLGINNEGAIEFDYAVEYHDYSGSGRVFNAESSTLWNNVELAFDAEISALYKRLRQDGIIDYTVIMNYLNVQQSDKWSESIYNEDSKFKYLDPLLESGNGSYLYAAQGSREEHRKWWLFNRIYYMDGKYQAGTSQSDFITMRLYTPTTWVGVAPNADFILKPLKDGHVAVKYGSYVFRTRAKKDSTALIVAPNIVFNDTETIIYGGSTLKSIGSLASKYVGTLDVSKAVNLTELEIGSDVYGYENKNLTSLTIGNNKLLKKVNLVGCTNLKKTIDFSGCTGLEELTTDRSGIIGLVLPDGGVMKKLTVPGIALLKIKNQPLLTQLVITIATNAALKGLFIDNTPIAFINYILNSGAPIKTIRLANTSITLADSDLLYYISKLRGYDENGDIIPVAYVSGTWNILTMYTEDYAMFQALFPNLNIVVTTLTDFFTLQGTNVVSQLIALGHDTNGDGKLSLAEIRAITSLPANAFPGLGGPFPSFRLFTGLTTWDRMFFNSTKTYLPSSIKRIEANVSGNFNTLYNYEDLEYIGANAFQTGSLSGNTSLIFRKLAFFGKNELSGARFETIDFTGSTITTFAGTSFSPVLLSSFTLNETLTRVGSVVLGMGSQAAAQTAPGFTITIPNSVKIIDGSAFGYAFVFINNVILGNSVEFIGMGAFADSYNISVPRRIPIVTIPASVQVIHDYAFTCQADCGYTGFIIESPIPFTITGSPFGPPSIMLSKGYFIYVPDSAVNYYKTATGWIAYAAVIKPVSQKPNN